MSNHLDLRGSSVARNPQAAQDSLYTKSCRRFAARVDKTDSWDFRRLLPVCSKRPCSRAAQPRDELAPSHSITSSARATSVGGSSRPSALAAARSASRANAHNRLSRWRLTEAARGDGRAAGPTACARDRDGTTTTPARPTDDARQHARARRCYDGTTRGGNLMPVGRTTRREFIAGLSGAVVRPVVPIMSQDVA